MFRKRHEDELWKLQQELLAAEEEEYEQDESEYEDDENYYISVFDYGNNYCLEIPFLLFVDNYLYDLDRIIIPKVE